MTAQTDNQLLRAYAEQRLEPAFTELVRRHVDFVHSAARRMVRDPHLAEDVTQGVFVALAKQAPELVGRTTLAGWLHRAAQNIAAQTVRTIERRRAREQEAFAMSEQISTSPDVSWEQIEPHLDAALGELNDADHDAVVLRYFHKKSAAEIAAILGVSDEAAQKRVSRAVERLREFFAKRGVSVGAGGLVVVIAANAVQAAPVGLAVTISAAALAGTATTSTFIAAGTKTVAMTTLQKSLITATVAVLAGAGIYEARQAAQLRDQVQTLQQQQAPLTEQIQQLQNSFSDATNRLANLLVENSRVKSNPQEMELLKLRGQTGMLREQNEKLSQALQNAEKQNHPTFPTNFISKDSWSFVGRDTPENAMKSALWAKSVGNENLFRAGATPEMTNTLNSEIQGDTDEARSQFLINKTKAISGYQILSKIPVGNDEVLMQVEFEAQANGQAANSVQMIVMKQIDGEWKAYDSYEDSEQMIKIINSLTGATSANANPTNTVRVIGQ